MLYTLRKHWKKSLFGSALLCYGFHYSSQRFREYLVRRNFFFAAKKYGEEFISPLQKPRRLYVILNPTANNGKCKKLFQKNAAPIFHLAGIEITYIQTDYEGHGKTIVNYFDPTIDGVVIAGGDGTVQEIVTGVLRQKEKDPVASLPLGIIPIGERSNAVHKRLFGSDVIHTRAMCTAALKIVEGKVKNVSVIELKNDQKSIFALDSIHIGSNQEVKEKIDERKYWLLGPLKSYFAYIWRTVKNWPPEDVVLLSSPRTEILNNIEHISPKFTSNASCLSVEKTGTRLDNCKASSLSLYLNDNNDGNPHLLVQITDKEETRKDFIKYGWKWIRNSFMYTPSECSKSLLCTELVITPSDQKDLKYGIDGEVFDAKPIHVVVHPQKVQMFSPS